MLLTVLLCGKRRVLDDVMPYELFEHRDFQLEVGVYAYI